MKKKQIQPQPTTSISIIDNQNRTVLQEGRSHQIGFAFLKKLEDGKFETVQPISPCKDYLNDVVYSESTGKVCTAYGLSYTKKDIFTEPFMYMAMKICPNRNGEPYFGQEADEKNLNENFENVQKYINGFEKLMSFEQLSTIDKVSDNLFLIKAPTFWSQYTYLISLYTLLIRTAQWYKEGDVQEYFTNYTKTQDTYNVKATLPKLQKLLKGHVPQQDFSKLYGSTDVHNLGIVSYHM